MDIVLLAGSVLLGWLLATLIGVKKKPLQFLLSFSGAFLLSVTVVHLIPETFSAISFHDATNKQLSLYVLFGLLVQSLLEFVTKGMEHGHAHHQKEGRGFPWLAFVGLGLHAFSEGMPIAHQQHSTLVWSIIVHKIPIGMVLTAMMLEKGYPKYKSLFFIGLFALCSPLGLVFSSELTVLSNYHLEINAFNIGIFLHVSTIILFESNKQHQFNWLKFLATVLGMLIVICRFPFTLY